MANEQSWHVRTDSVDRTTALGRVLGMCLSAGDLILLDGTLGVGKTHFAQGVADGIGVFEPVTSPTFTYIAEHDDGRVPFVHMDLYRLYDDPASETAKLSFQALEQISFDDYLDERQVVLIEWPQGVKDSLDDYLLVAIQYVFEGDELGHPGGDQIPETDLTNLRDISVVAKGFRSEARLKEWMNAWA